MTFENDLIIGEIAEKQIINYFARNGWIVEDLRNDNYWRAHDVDIRIEKDNKQFLFEIKRQKSIETNSEIIIELYNYKSEKTGWYYYSRADYFVFVPFNGEIAYIISAFQLKNYVDNNDIRKEYNEYSNCLLGYLPIKDIKSIAQKIDLRG